MKKVFVLFFGLLFTSSLSAQSSKNYYVSSKSLNLRMYPNSKSEVMYKLSRYDNLRLIKKDSANWTKVSYNGSHGYVYSKYIKLGRAIVSAYSVRVGAKCRDGWNSSATGRGACSHHGGVSYWKTREKKSVRIQN